MRLIGISGKLGTGKTTVAGMLKALLPEAVCASYSSLLKEEAAARFDFNPAYGFVDKERFIPLTPERADAGMPEGMTVRRLLQWYGTDVVRARDPDHWVKAMRARLRDLAGRARYVIIDDVRFPNEAALIKECGGFLVRLLPYPGYAPEESTRCHASETALDDYPAWDFRFQPGYGPLHLQEVARELAACLTRDIWTEPVRQAAWPCI